MILGPNLDWTHGQNLLIGIGLAVIAVTFHSLSTVLVKKYNHGLPNTHIVAGAVWITSTVYLLAHPQFLTQLPTLPPKALNAHCVSGGIRLLSRIHPLLLRSETVGCDSVGVDNFDYAGHGVIARAFSE